MRKYDILLISLFLAGLVLVLRPADPKTEHDPKRIARLTDCVIAEAQNQPEAGQRAVACAIINRPEGIAGVFGLKRSEFIAQTPTNIKRIARQAAIWALDNPDGCWDLVQGADMWENTIAFGQPYGWGPVYRIKTIGDHTFYRRLTSGPKK